MLYEAYLKKIDMDEHQGHLYMQIGGIDLKAYYFAPNEYIENKIHPDTKVTIDLWLVVGNVVKQDGKLGATIISNDSVDKIIGVVTSTFSDRELQVDCTVLIDVESEETITDVYIGDQVEVIGDFQVYFPESCWDRDSVKI